MLNTVESLRTRNSIEDLDSDSDDQTMDRITRQMKSEQSDEVKQLQHFRPLGYNLWRNLLGPENGFKYVTEDVDDVELLKDAVNFKKKLIKVKDGIRF